MKTKLLSTIAGIFFLATFQVFSSIPVVLNSNQEMQSETQFANGKVLTVKVHSQGIANNMLGDSEYRKVSIYLPPGYIENSTTNYPVIYMLSDVNGTNEDWFQILGSTDFIETLDKLITQGGIKPAIMVFPDGKNKIGGSWYTNSSVTGNWEDFVVNDVVNYIDQNFRTLPFAASRGIAGKGMGGYGALKLATKHADVFSAVYSLNALVDFETMITHEYIWSNSMKIATEALQYPTPNEFANKLLGMAVAFAPDPNKPVLLGNLPKTENGEIVNDVFEKWLDQDPLQMIGNYTNNLNLLKAISVDCSNSDACIMLSSNYSKALTENGIKNSFSYFTGTEKNDLLKRVTDVMLPMFSENLAHSLLDFKAKPWYVHNDVLQTKLITDGSIYIVPVTVNSSISLKSDEIIKIDAKANFVNDIHLNSMSTGIYRIYGVSNSGFTGKSIMFGVNGGIPQVTISVFCSCTGQKMKTCEMTVNGKLCVPGPDGDHCFAADENLAPDGKIMLCVKNKNYGELTKSVVIHTDTTLNISLIKDSHLQVVEKGTNKPVFESTVTHNNQATLTDVGGFTTIQNIQNGVLECRIFKSGYHTESVNMQLEPGKTAVVELTPKKADVNFVLIGTEGHLADGIIKIGTVSLKPDEFGKAKLNGLDTRVEYSYTIQNASYNVVQNSFYLESDITLPIYLEPKAVNEAQLKSDLVATSIKDNFINDIQMYPNPATNEITVQISSLKGFTVELRTETGALLQKEKTEGTLHRINLSNLSNGVYFVTVKTDNFYYTRKIMKL